MEDKQSFSTSEVAAYCHVTPDTIRKWAEAGRIKVFKTPGGHRRISREDLLAFLKDNDLPIHPDLSSAPTTILVIDSEKTTSALISRFFDHAQSLFKIHTATDAYQAGYCMATHEPDIIFLDLQFPCIDSVQLCQSIRSSAHHAHAHIIAMTASKAAPLAQDALAQGASLLMEKPFTPDDLRRVLAQTGTEIA